MLLYIKDVAEYLSIYISIHLTLYIHNTTTAKKLMCTLVFQITEDVIMHVVSKKYFFKNSKKFQKFQ